ncbi:SCP2 sterol-binding domain-containing protein [Psychrobium sp. 1_MG-2023]|uniref:SCP2 sterol-binding domain-containing protein n=1 Tax=Psychrobium sp. 1_MG-2023 TaxID=3062624 RepID=UPI000C321B3A|nr:SCP2 sterol-binding domain-containing protein [Psychrobium sp. 1_MG-2023]MDP2561799.1 SCP2 sterol-binding domain-containing protein [Psychrobium sp. 1_MG-2023]PKF55827.1 SCP-2 family sterol carrier protein [Alteromonadales bacterium alter-6D02]
MSIVAEYTEILGRKFNSQAAAGVNEVFQFDLEGELFHLIIADAKFELVEGEHQDPSVTLILKSSTLKGLLDGSVNGMTAFMMGKVKAVGDMMLATKLPQLFPA